MLEKLKKMNEEVGALRLKHLEEAKSLFGEISAELFKKHPSLEKFSWNQYTPYFNDGDTCEFSVNYYSLEVNGTEEYDDQLDDTKPEFNKPLFEAYEECEKFLGVLDESVLKQMFGDHCEITVTSSGVNVEEYSHD